MLGVRYPISPAQIRDADVIAPYDENIRFVFCLLCHFVLLRFYLVLVISGDHGIAIGSGALDEKGLEQPERRLLKNEN
jgi:hypothetical protein